MDLKEKGQGIQEFVVDRWKNWTPLHIVVLEDTDNGTEKRTALMNLLSISRDQPFLDYQDSKDDTPLHVAWAT
jgi:hypothetical protein